MARRLVQVDRVALVGSVVGLLSLVAGWLTLKPNRLAQGTSYHIDGAITGPGADALVLVWFACLALSLWQRRARLAIALGMAGNAALIAVFIAIGAGSRHLLTGQPDLARVSLSSGVWMALAAAYSVIFAARQGLAGRATWRALVSWGWAAVFLGLVAAGWFDSLSLAREFASFRGRFFQELGTHISLAIGSTLVAAAIAVPLGVWAARSRHAERAVSYVTNIVQTVPSLALFGLLIAPLSALSFAFPVLRDFGIRGVGTAPAVIALVVYSLLPVVRNTYTGLRQTDAAAIDAGRGMGMRRTQVFWRVELPLAAPLILEGVRTAAVQAVGLTTVAALIGAGGLGWFVFQGIGQAAPDQILLGALPVLALALAVDGLMRGIVRLGTPRALRSETA